MNTTFPVLLLVLALLMVPLLSYCWWVCWTEERFLRRVQKHGPVDVGAVTLYRSSSPWFMAVTADCVVTLGSGHLDTSLVLVATCVCVSCCALMVVASVWRRPRFWIPPALRDVESIPVLVREGALSPWPIVSACIFSGVVGVAAVVFLIVSRRDSPILGAWLMFVWMVVVLGLVKGVKPESDYARRIREGRLARCEELDRRGGLPISARVDRRRDRRWRAARPRG